MKNTFILFLFLGFSISTSAQSEKEDLAEIRTLYSQIQQEKATYDTTKTEIWDESTEGGEIVKYYKNGELKMIEKKLFGEMFKETNSYYFHEDKLFFAFIQHHQYLTPMYFEGELTEMKNAGTSCEFVSIPRKSNLLENRYYFKNEKLFLWVDEEKVKLDLPNEKLAEAETIILKQINRILQE